MRFLDWIFSLVLFMLFLTFYLTLIPEQKIETKKLELVNKIKEIEDKFYLINLTVSFSRDYYEFFCKNKYLRRDFCEWYPVYLPDFLPDFYPKNGLILNTPSNYSKFGLFALINISKPDKIENWTYIICNLEDKDLININVNLTLPEILVYYLNLKNGKYIKVFDEKGNFVPFCFDHRNLECNRTPSEKIWIKISLSKGECKKIFIDLSNINYATNGKNVFAYYTENFSDWDKTKKVYFKPVKTNSSLS